MYNFRLRPVVVAVTGVMACNSIAFAENNSKILETGTVEVVSTTPLPGVGLPLEQIPAAIKMIKGEEMAGQHSLTIADFMQQNLVGVNVNETQNNPYQPNVNYHGFTASPLLGTPQGLSVYYDGVRINEPFGDVVSWDLAPMNAISSMSMIPGSNPLFGLNTIGGAISLHTKSGRTHPGGVVEASLGSWDRTQGQFAYGGVAENNVDYFISGNVFDENGWRDYSPSHVRQLFGKLGWQNDTTALNFSLTAANNNMIGNGYQSLEFLKYEGWDSVYTVPDVTANKMVFAVLDGSHWLSDKTMLSGNLYYRHARTRTLNGDLNDDVDPASFAADCAGSASPDTDCGGALNRSQSDRVGYGFTAQSTFNHDLWGRKNQFIAGVGYDYSRVTFGQSTEYGNIISGSRGVASVGEIDDESAVSLHGRTSTWSLFATDTVTLTEVLHLTLSGRYNNTRVENRDQLIPDRTDPESLSGEHRFSRLNPSVGLALTPGKDFSVYANYNEGSRAPTAIELGCANPDLPCKLPNAMAGDPPLDMVISRTYEAGIRGKMDAGVGYSASIYRTRNTDDIQFVAANTTGAGYFDNVGKTRRVGFDLGLDGAQGNFKWFAGYSYVKATYESDFALASQVNSSAVDTDGDGEGDTIFVNKGDNIPGIPHHQYKFRGEWQVLPAWVIGTNVVSFSDQYAVGNENNNHQGGGGKVPGYTVVNLDTRYDFGNSGWQVFAKINNLFNREYYSGGMLGESMFTPSGQMDGGEGHFQPFYSPGAPRAGWVGVRYEFGGAKRGSSLDRD